MRLLLLFLVLQLQPKDINFEHKAPEPHSVEGERVEWEFDKLSIASLKGVKDGVEVTVYPRDYWELRGNKFNVKGKISWVIEHQKTVYLTEAVIDRPITFNVSKLRERLEEIKRDTISEQELAVILEEVSDEVRND